MIVKESIVDETSLYELALKKGYLLDNVKNIGINKDVKLPHKKSPMDGEPRSQNTEKAKKEKSKVELLNVSCETVIDILNNVNSLDFDDETKGLLREIQLKIAQALQVRNPLELEVAKLVSGETVLPKYDVGAYGSPIGYLREHFKKYLKCFGAENDFISRQQIKAINPSFASTLGSYFTRHKEEALRYHIPKKSDLINKEIAYINSLPEAERERYSRMTSLDAVERYRKGVNSKKS